MERQSGTRNLAVALPRTEDLAQQDDLYGSRSPIDCLVIASARRVETTAARPSSRSTRTRRGNHFQIERYIRRRIDRRRHSLWFIPVQNCGIEPGKLLDI